MGVGFTSILWYDAIVASTDARFSMRFAALGFTPEVSAAYSLARVVGMQRAKEIMLTARIYNAEEALELGIVRKLVVPERLMPEAIALAAEIAANPAPALKAIKEQTFRDLFAPSIEEVMELSDFYLQQTSATVERFEALVAAREKRPPRFFDPAHMAAQAEAMRQAQTNIG
jgi:enoyl-CoA hydratase/carnithine racemase